MWDDDSSEDSNWPKETIDTSWSKYMDPEEAPEILTDDYLIYKNKLMFGLKFNGEIQNYISQISLYDELIFCENFYLVHIEGNVHEYNHHINKDMFVTNTIFNKDIFYFYT